MRGFDDGKRNRRETGEMQFLGCSRRDVDDPTFSERPAIVDPHHDSKTVVQISDANHGAERQGAMGRGQLVWQKSFAARGHAAVLSADRSNVTRRGRCRQR